MGDEITDGVEKKTEEKKSKLEAMKAFYEKVKVFMEKVGVKFEAMCVKLDENLPRKSYIFLAMTFAVLSSLLQLLF